MYSKFQIAKKYFFYLLTASNGKGHGIHSPFVFNFITRILNDKKSYDCYKDIEKLRSGLLGNHNYIWVDDFGAGSYSTKGKKRKISAIASSSLKSKKYGQLLYRIARYYQPVNILELGTSLGITTCYLACSHESSNIISLEGATEVAAVAKKNLESLQLKNASVITGDFKDTLSIALITLKTPDLVFIDGHHRKTATLEYFSRLLSAASDSSIFIFDDIHWSREMEEAWAMIRNNKKVTLSVDLFFLGIIFFNPDIKVAQHFTIRF